MKCGCPNGGEISVLFKNATSTFVKILSKCAAAIWTLTTLTLTVITLTVTWSSHKGNPPNTKHWAIKTPNRPAAETHCLNQQTMLVVIALCKQLPSIVTIKVQSFILKIMPFLLVIPSTGLQTVVQQLVHIARLTVFYILVYVLKKYKFIIIFNFLICLK